MFFPGSKQIKPRSVATGQREGKQLMSWANLSHSFELSNGHRCPIWSTWVCGTEERAYRYTR